MSVTDREPLPAETLVLDFIEQCHCIILRRDFTLPVFIHNQLIRSRPVRTGPFPWCDSHRRRQNRPVQAKVGILDDHIGLPMRDCRWQPNFGEEHGVEQLDPRSHFESPWSSDRDEASDSVRPLHPRQQ